MTARPLTAAELRAIEERANAATPGRWEAPFDSYVLTRGASGKVCQLDDPWITNKNRAADAEFIAHAREDVPRLVATVKALQAYRAACWVWEPEEDSGFDRVNAALAVFTVVRSWLDSGRITIGEDEDPESFYECLNEAEFLGRELLRVCRAEANAGLVPLNIAPPVASVDAPNELLPDAAHRCAVCKREWVDSDAGYDTCARCVRAV